LHAAQTVNGTRLTDPEAMTRLRNTATPPNAADRGAYPQTHFGQSASTIIARFYGIPNPNSGH
jgi:hypothetical protein